MQMTLSGASGGVLGRPEGPRLPLQKGYQERDKHIFKVTDLGMNSQQKSEVARRSNINRISP